MMRTYEWLLLRLYPKDYRDEFGPEMLGVHRSLCEAPSSRREKLRVLVRETIYFAGHGVASRFPRPETWRVLGGIGLAFALQLAAYGVLLPLFRRTHQSISGLANRVAWNSTYAQSLTLLGVATVLVILLIPYLLFLCSHVRFRRRLC